MKRVTGTPIRTWSSRRHPLLAPVVCRPKGNLRLPVHRESRRMAALNLQAGALFDGEEACFER